MAVAEMKQHRDTSGLRTVLVLGASSGLGRGIAERLASDGLSVIAAARNTERLSALEQQTPNVCDTVEVDLSNSPSVDRFLECIDSGMPNVDAVVLNSGGPPMSQASNLDSDVLRDVLEMLVVSQVRIVQAVLPSMRARGWGRIVSIGSSGVIQPIGGLAYSNLGRAALAGYLKTLASEVAGEGITVNTVLPGRIGTERVMGIDETRAESSGKSLVEVQDASRSMIPAGRYGRTEEFAAAVSFLCRDEASYITGSMLRVDGGLIASTS